MKKGENIILNPKDVRGNEVSNMKKLIRASKREYRKILNSIISYIEQSKLKAFAEVNRVLLQVYWNIGKRLSENASYGKAVVEKLSQDLRLKYPDARGYSERNLWNMKRFYEIWQKLQTVSAESLLFERYVLVDKPKAVTVLNSRK